MSSYGALLRGVNVGGARKLPMPKLRDSLSALGLGDVRTYLQSGNVVFTDAGRDAVELGRAIADRISADFGLDVDVLVLGGEELARVVGANPFAARPDADIRPLHVTFLSDSIDGARFSALELPATDGEEAAVGERVVYLRLPHGYGRTKLHNGYFERATGTTATTRNWRTVLSLAEMTAES